MTHIICSADCGAEGALAYIRLVSLTQHMRASPRQMSRQLSPCVCKSRTYLAARYIRPPHPGPCVRAPRSRSVTYAPLTARVPSACDDFAHRSWTGGNVCPDRQTPSNISNYTYYVLFKTIQLKGGQSGGTGCNEWHNARDNTVHSLRYPRVVHGCGGPGGPCAN